MRFHDRWNCGKETLSLQPLLPLVQVHALLESWSLSAWVWGLSNDDSMNGKHWINNQYVEWPFTTKKQHKKKRWASTTTRRAKIATTGQSRGNKEPRVDCNIYQSAKNQPISTNETDQRKIRQKRNNYQREPPKTKSHGLIIKSSINQKSTCYHRRNIQQKRNNNQPKPTKKRAAGWL